MDDTETSARRALGARGRLPSLGRSLLLAVLAGGAVALGSSQLGLGTDVDGARAAAAPKRPAGARRAELAPGAPRASTSQAIGVYIDTRHPAAPVPRSFLGLSFELSSLRQVAAYANGGDFVRLLRSLGPGVLRFGGVSADTRVAWSDPATPPPAWASSVLEPTDMRALARLAARSGWRVLLTVGLAHFEPLAAAREAAAAKAVLGARLAGIEVGNEPNAYMVHGLREAPWTFRQYAAQAAAYRRAIAAAAPGVALAGPDTSGSSAFLRWGRGEARQLRPSLLTGHHYPLGCHEVPAPSVARLLSLTTRDHEGISTGRYMKIARRSGIPFRMDEANTVSCGGRTGISDTFASALWAVGYIARNMSAGVAGINLHGDPANCHGYTPLCAATRARYAQGALSAQPEWYAVLLARALVGDRPLRAKVRRPPRAAAAARTGVNVSVLMRSPRELHVVIVDYAPPGSPSVLVHLHAGRRLRSARLLALSAPSLLSESGVQLGGRSVQADGSWHEARALPTVAAHRGVIRLVVAPSSAMLVTITP